MSLALFRSLFRSFPLRLAPFRAAIALYFT